MKAILIGLFVISMVRAINYSDYQCKGELLQFYGLVGPENGGEPIHYQSIKNEIGFDACPNIEYSCCTVADFKLSKTKWDAKADTIKRYLTKLFRIIQRTTVMQGSLLEMSNMVRTRDNKFCREIDSTFFQKAIQFDEIFFYLQNSLNAFAYMQRGFYCAVCDAKNHKYLAVKDEENSSVRTATIDVKFCNDLIFFFKEFIMFKVFYIDPMIINTNFLFNCYENTDEYRFDFNYNTTYNTIESCVERGEGCEYVCKEFRLGTASDLFIGRLSDYHTFFNNLERILTKFNPNFRNEFESEAVVDEELYPEEFFADIDPDRSPEERDSLGEYDMSKFKIKIAEKGINMFDISSTSNYHLTSIASTSNSKSIISETGPLGVGDDLDEQKKAEWEEQHEAEKMQQDPNTPSKAQLTSLVFERDNMENDFSNAINTRGTVDYEAGTNTSNFSAAAKIPRSNPEGAIILYSAVIGLIVAVLN